jgi:multidrug efflux pump subunit AcrB
MAEEARKLQKKYVDPESGESVIRNILISKGWSGGGRPGISGQSELGQISLETVPPEERTLAITSSEIVREWRKGIGAIPGVKELTFRAEIGRGGAPIDIMLMGEDLKRMGELAAKLKSRLAEYPGVFDIQDSLEAGKEEILLTVKPEAEFLGLSASELGRQVRSAFFGTEVQRIQRGRDDVRVMIRYPEAERENISSLESMRVRTREGAEVPIGNVANVELGRGYAKVRRVDRHRAVNVTADVLKGKVDVNQIVRDLRTFLDAELITQPDIRYSLEGELREQRESFGSMLYGVMFVLFAIYALLAIPFRSYVQPIVVMLVIPFSLIGAILGHMIMGMNLSIMSIFGMLALSGVVVNDSLVLVDYINRRRREGRPLDEAIRAAGIARFRPIMLTSLTTFVGLVPLILEKSTQAQFLIPMAVSLGFGILYATFLSLLLIPVGYRILEDVRGMLGIRDKSMATDPNPA